MAGTDGGVTVEQRLILAVVLSFIAEAGTLQNAEAMPPGQTGKKPANLTKIAAVGDAKAAQKPADKAAAPTKTAAAAPAKPTPAAPSAAGSAAAKPADKAPAGAAASAGAPAQKPLDPAFTAALNKGIDLFNKNKIDEALVEFLKALEIESNNTAVRNWMGAAYQRQNKHKEAIEIYEQVVQLDPDYAEAHNNLAFSYQSTQDYEKAESEYKRALELKPAMLQARLNLATVLQKEKKYDEALKEYEAVLKADPSKTECYLFMGDLAKDLKDTDKAMKYYNKALEINKKDPAVICRIALIYRAQGNKDKCKDLLEQVLDIDPSNYDALLTQGIISFEASDLGPCLEHLGKALERNPYDAAVHYWLGRYYIALDSYGKAIKQFEDAKKCDPTGEECPETDAWLEKAKDLKAKN